ncbi:Acyl-CoA Delta(11) desaturase [Cryptotermes secundus]|uniref:Acyl-CoA Delta(11) desaturase n=2 Tax=Cryptotermes secundus TaxID=105785 RepID=A0A2J7PNI7_9NEOP|nr:Acyl-CoA Delta(11) desaturase [Cryptotermes secundus]
MGNLFGFAHFGFVDAVLCVLLRISLHITLLDIGCALKKRKRNFISRNYSRNKRRNCQYFCFQILNVMGTTIVTTETQSLRDPTSYIRKGTDQKYAINETAESSNSKFWSLIVWKNVILFLYVHLAAIYGFYLAFTKIKGITTVWGLVYTSCGGLGITAGAHRLWAHRSYKATWQLRIILGIFQTIAFQNHIYEWARDHRVHHKFSETDADPHNAKRGFFFSHVGWLLMKKHPDVKSKGKVVDMSDLEEDFVVVFQRRYYYILMPLLTFIIPTLVPVFLWNEDPWMAWYSTMFRWVLALNCTWLVNSAAHMWGNKPYDKNISPAENMSVAILAYGEGFHNYHHVFPYDYKAAELGDYMLNPTTAFIDFFARIGWAYSLKTMSRKTIMARILRTGDGTHKRIGRSNSPDCHTQEDHVWGWGDADMKEEDCKFVSVLEEEEE